MVLDVLEGRSGHINTFDPVLVFVEIVVTSIDVVLESVVDEVTSIDVVLVSVVVLFLVVDVVSRKSSSVGRDRVQRDYVRRRYLPRSYRTYVRRRSSVRPLRHSRRIHECRIRCLAPSDLMMVKSYIQCRRKSRKQEHL